jgi:hypothetical protein
VNNPVTLLAVLAFATLVPICLWSIWQFHQQLQSDHPDWVDVRRTLSPIYRFFPRVFDPNISWRTIRIALSKPLDQLPSRARSAAMRIRILLPLGLALFAVVLVGILGAGV